MYDPTIFDNLKVVLEGGLYDLDAAGRIMVTGREDLVDLASMGRALRMEIRLPLGVGRATVRMSSALPDFAAELRGLSTVGVPPGAALVLKYELPGELASLPASKREFLQEQWGSEAEISYQETIRHLSGSEPERTFEAVIRFLSKIDESHIRKLDSFAEHFVASLELLEQETNK